MIRYELGHEVWPTWSQTLTQLVSRPGVARVCDIGGGAKPSVPLDEIRQHGLDYVVVDISEDELRKAPSGYTTQVADVLSSHLSHERGPYDVVLSRMVAEHISDPRTFHRTIFNALTPGGIAAHFFSTLYEPAFVFNRLFPERLTEALVKKVQPFRDPEGDSAKFPAYYRWCRGPSPRQLRRLESTGFELDSFSAFFGHKYYARFGPLDKMNRSVSRFLVRHPSPALTSFAIVVLRRPRI